MLTYGPQAELEGAVITGRMHPANQFAKRRRVLRTSPQLLSLKAKCHKLIIQTASKEIELLATVSQQRVLSLIHI